MDKPAESCEPILLRPLRPGDDLHEVGEIAARIWCEHYPGIISWAQIHYMLERSYSIEVIAGELERGVRWVCALRGESHCGFAAYRLDGPERVRLDKLYVAREVRGHGIARRFLDELMAWSLEQGASLVDLTVNKSNSGSIEAYRRLGFSIQRALVAEIGHGFVMDDYVMQRALTASA